VFPIPYISTSLPLSLSSDISCFFYLHLLSTSWFFGCMCQGVCLSGPGGFCREMEVEGWKWKPLLHPGLHTHGGNRPWHYLVPSLSFAEGGKRRESCWGPWGLGWGLMDLCCYEWSIEMSEKMMSDNVCSNCGSCIRNLGYKALMERNCSMRQ
jgi:hypothetical protein